MRYIRMVRGTCSVMLQVFLIKETMHDDSVVKV